MYLSIHLLICLFISLSVNRYNSLISRRSVPTSARIKRIIRPKRGSNPGAKDHNIEPIEATEAADEEVGGVCVSNPSTITGPTLMVVTGVDVGLDEVHSAAPTVAAPVADTAAPVADITTIASSSADSKDAMDITTSSAGEEDKTDSDPCVGAQIATSGIKTENAIQSSIALEGVDGREIKDEQTGEEMNIEDEREHKSHSHHPSIEGGGNIIPEDGREGTRLSAVVKDEINLISFKVETENEEENEEEMSIEMEMEAGIESKLLSVKNETDVEVEVAVDVKIRSDLDPSCDTHSMKEEGIVDLLLVEGDITDDSSKKVKKEEDVLKEKERKLIVPGAVNVPQVAVPEPQRNAPLPPITLPRAPDSLSAIHGLRGFLDVGNDALFSTSEPWVLATASLLAKRKLARN